MVKFTLPSRPSLAEWEKVEAAIAAGHHVVIRCGDGQHNALRQVVSRLGVLDVTDGGDAGIEIARAA